MKVSDLLEAVNKDIFWESFRKEKKILDGEFVLIATAGYIEHGAKNPHKSKQFVITAKTKKGLQVGKVNFEVSDDKLEAIDVTVNEKFRRQGIASEMYKFARELGNDIKKSPKQTALGRAFWAKDHSKSI